MLKYLEKQAGASVLNRLGIACLSLWLSACAVPQPEPTTDDSLPLSQTQGPPTSPQPISPDTAPYQSSGILASSDNDYSERSRIYPGTGRFLNPRASIRPSVEQQSNGEVTLNFEAADIREVIGAVFEALQENYVIDQAIQGTVTIQTSRPLPRDRLLPTLETLLRANNAALIRSDGLYRVVPAGAAIAGSQTPRLTSARLGPGYSVRVFPLRYIGALEMQKILEPFAPEEGILLVDSARNLLILAGTEQELNYLQETINLFDVNWLKGMSVGLYILENVESQTLATELENLFGTGSDLPMAGMFRFVPIARLNGILVITPQPEFLREASVWIERLDGSGGERLYIYEVENGDADYLASVLSQVFDAETASVSGSSNQGAVAPGLSSTNLSSPASSSFSSSSGIRTSANFLRDTSYAEDSDGIALQISEGEPAVQQQPPAARQAPGARREPTILGTGAGAASASSGAVGGGSAASNVRIIADVENNALLIWANVQTYEKIVRALRRLDITPRQVLIEATIAEVTLTGRLRYGLRWFFTHDLGRYEGIGSLRQNIGQTVSNALSGNDVFSYIIAKNDIVRLMLDLLESETQLRILSSPQVMVVDNQEAEIRVGFQQPFQTSTTTTDGGNETQSFTLKDTGVFLKVSPQVNSSGLVSLDIDQEVIDVGAIDDATGQRSFFQRRVSSRVAVRSGQSIVLGGLISETKRDSESGIPVLYKLPVVGPLFGEVDKQTDRTELLVLITPRVIQNTLEAEQITDEIKRRMKAIDPFPAQTIYRTDAANSNRTPQTQ